MELKYTVDASFVFDHGSATAAVLKEKFQDIPCIMYLLVLKH
jgi:hypothetical protein